ncbi:hypothetical protein [Methylobacterium radiotolerans]|uniref:hypothetical protein n=1 Tax=Methylobacterium radiotolerans TaxID=31998 RepID=UPI0015F594EB|nr:hypothetical protein [Methylobacterium radiotolerans]
MASAFDEIWADASADLDAEFGESLMLYPRAAAVDPSGRPDPNARPVASVARAPVPFVGIFFDKGAMLHAHGRSMADSTTRPVVAERPMIDVSRGQFQGREPAQGDLVQRLAPVAIYEVTRFVVDDLDRAWVHLAEQRIAGAQLR